MAVTDCEMVTKPSPSSVDEDDDSVESAAVGADELRRDGAMICVLLVYWLDDLLLFEEEGVGERVCDG